MSENPAPPQTPVPAPPLTSARILPIAALLMALGSGGLLVLALATMPTIWPRWLLFFCIVLAFSGLSLPVVAFLNRRFPSLPPATEAIAIRQSLWVGAYAAAMAWLQIGRVLDPALALLLLIGLGLIEFLIRLGERSQWKP